MLWIGTAATLVAGIVALMVVILAKSPVCSERRRDLRGTVESGRQGHKMDVSAVGSAPGCEILAKMEIPGLTFTKGPAVAKAAPKRSRRSKKAALCVNAATSEQPSARERQRELGKRPPHTQPASLPPGTRERSTLTSTGMTCGALLRPTWPPRACRARRWVTF
jgi:hypothetical protein